MKHRLTALSQNYVTALRTHLKPGSPAHLLSARGLGRQAVGLGLGTLDLARIHEHALATLTVSPKKLGLVRRAENFFTGFNVPVEETHRAVQQGKAELNRLEATLGQRTEELAADKRQLQRGVVRRRVMELAADKRGRHYRKNPEESLTLQRRLRRLTQRVIAAQENDRKKISHELHDEVAQTLLGINVRLLALKKQARGNAESFKSEVASTQRLVAKSARSVRQVAREMGHQ